jgi:hypothetical protein
MNEPIHIISLGAGVQSSTMALMAAHGEIMPMPKFAIFADTGDEQHAIYEWLFDLTKLLPFPTLNARRKTELNLNLSDMIVERGHTQIPAWFAGKDGRGALGKRQCTSKWKIEAIERRIREHLGLVRRRIPNGSVIQWIGISLDEAHRMKPSRNNWQTNRWPLIELRMRRHDCLLWLMKHGYPTPPKSACVYCPYQDDSRWRKLKKENGADWRLAKRVEASLLPGEFLHRSLKPLDQVDFSTDEDHGQQVMFGNECEGMCGV